MIVRVNKRHAELIVPERITSGSVGMTVTLEFSAEWSGLNKTAVFTDLGANSYDVLESSWDGNVVQIPHELMQTAGNPVWLGVYGCETNEDDDVVLAIPTVYCKLGTVKQGADPSGDESTDPTLAVWAQLQQDVDNVEDAIANEAIARANADSTETQNRRSADLALSTQIAAKQDKLIAGSGITIAEDGKTISSTGGGGGSSAWADITGKPSTFPPSAHEHTVSEITDFPSNIGAYIGDTEPADAEAGALWVDTDDNSGSQENRPKYRLYKTVTIEQDVLEYSEEFEGDVTGFYVVVKSPGTVATQLLLRAYYTKNGEQNEGIYLNNVFVTSGVRYGDVEADIKDGMLTIEGHMYSTALGGTYGTFTRSSKVDLIDKIDRFYAKTNASGTTIPTGTEFTIYVRR